MEGLQRSSSTFRRSGSSGLVWDERFLTEDPEAKAAAGEGGTDGAQPEMRRSRSTGGVGMMLRRAGGGGGDDKKKQQQQQQKKKQQGGKKDEERDQQVFRTKEVAPDMDPPSPRVSGCILCAIFGGAGSGPSSAARRGGRAKPKRKQR